jgi:nucleoredoxin
MRRFVLFALTIFAVATQAAQLPLTVSEISLMLRAGYSSKALMQELSARHFADVLDESKESALNKAGASPELIAALKSGAYSLSADKTAAVLKQMETEAERRAQQAEASQKAEARYQAQIVRERTAQPNAALNTGGTAAVSEFLKSDLVQMRNGELKHSDEAALANKKLIAFYFSAEWCGPCRKFTPQLVEYYKRVTPEHPEFEIVFYSSDKSQYAMEKYMRDENMPWLAIDFTKLKDKAALKKNAGDGIPSLVLVDADGNIISSAVSGGQYVGPQKVLGDLDAIFSGKVPARVASAQ